MKETKLQKEDLSDMVAEHAAKQKVSHTRPKKYLFIPIPHNLVPPYPHISIPPYPFSPPQKRKRAATDSSSGKASKKLKEFKF